MKLTELTATALSKNNEQNGYARGFFSLVSENHSAMSKEELITIIKELDYTAQNLMEPAEYNKLIEQTLNSVEEAEVFE